MPDPALPDSHAAPYSPPLAFAILLANVSCYHCGLPYAVPRYLFMDRRAAGGEIACPGCGKWTRWAEKAPEDDPAAVEKRRAALLDLHNQEQAEARAADVAGAAASEHRAAELDAAPHACPNCHRSFKSAAWLANHIRKAHKQEAAQ